MKIIETKNLTKMYGKSRGILQLNLSVEEGDVFGFIGPNGAGKSTTIRTLLGLISPTEGEAYIFGRDCTKHKKEILKDIGYMPSETQFYSQMRVEDVIKLAADLHKKDCKAEAARLCERLQLDTKKRMEELSLGNRKKVNIVCAMQHNPRLLILDEPTSGLDPLMQKEFFEALKEKNKEGTTIFFSSHVLFEVQEHCKNAAIIREGKLIKTAAVTELMAGNAKTVTLAGVQDISMLHHVSGVENTENGVRFLYNGDMQELLQHLCRLNPVDVTITEPGLEEIFMHFYEEGR